MGGKKKNKGNSQKPIVNATSSNTGKTQKSKQQMNKIMSAITNMDLDTQEFIDVASFDQSKAILENALDDLQYYLKMFEKGQYDKFPKVKPAVVE